MEDGGGGGCCCCCCGGFVNCGWMGFFFERHWLVSVFVGILGCQSLDGVCGWHNSCIAIYEENRHLYLRLLTLSGRVQWPMSNTQVFASQASVPGPEEIYSNIPS